MNTNDEQNSMANDELPLSNEASEMPAKPVPSRPAPLPPSMPASRAFEPRHGFFTIYKRGQGYWTRMGTAGASGLLALLTALFLYETLPTWGVSRGITMGVITGFAIAFAILCYWIQNKPGNVDFLIATDGEMKKVNWTSRKELIGSTKVVIFFMFLIAAILFFVDVLFGYFFQFIKVLKYGPFQG